MFYLKQKTNLDFRGMENLIDNTERAQSLKSKIIKLNASGLLRARSKIKLPDIIYFQPISIKPGPKIRAYELDISGTDISAIPGYILIYSDRIEIYRWKDTIKLVKTIDSHLIVFLLKSNSICRIKNVLFNILLTVYSQDIERFSGVCEDVLLFLKIENVVDMRISNEFLVVDRSDGQFVYNQRLQRVDFLVRVKDTNCISHLSLSFCSLKISLPDKPFDEEVYFGEYKKIVFIENYALVLMKNKLMILAFEE